MRIAATSAGVALLLAGCAPEALTLPEEPVDRAATCGVVAAAEARAATPNIRQPLPFTAQGRIAHYTLLAGVEGEEFSEARANEARQRMSTLQEEITEGRWEELVPACRAAFPEAERTEVTLPANRLDAQLGCDELGDFMINTLRGQDADYGNQLSEYRALARELDAALVSGLRARAGGDLAAQQQVRREALADMAELGPPVIVMRQCIERYGTQ